MRPGDFYAMEEGWLQDHNARLEHDRAMTFFIISPHMKQGFTYDKFKNSWRMPYDEVKEIEPISKAQRDAILAFHMKKITKSELDKIIN